MKNAIQSFALTVMADLTNRVIAGRHIRTIRLTCLYH